MNELDRLQCEQVFKKLDDYIDAELSAEEMDLIRQHLDICAWCAGAYQFQSGVLKEVEARLQRIPAPDNLRDKVAAALRQARAGT
jgi:mycothiol system anti-sigma-R factor